MSWYSTNTKHRFYFKYLKAFAIFCIAGLTVSCNQKSNSADTGIDSGKKAAEPVVQLQDTMRKFPLYAQNYFDRYWNMMQKRVRYTGVTLLVKNDSFYVWYGGEADSGIALNPNMPMQIASISKTFCASAVMILYHRGKIRLTDSLRQYFPELPYYNITIEQLLSHSSGLPEYTWFCDQLWKDSGLITNKKLIQLLASKKPEPYFKPGKRHRYTNTNFTLLASIIEKISGLSYPEFLKQNIFSPLGMKNSRVLPPGTDFNLLEVKGHYGNGMEFEPHYQDGTYGDKNIVSTVWDLYRFYLGLKENKLFPESIREEMFRTRWPNARRGTAYALGWRKRYFKDETWMFHSGWWHGYRTNLYLNFEKNECAVILSNRLSGGFIPAKTITGFFHPEDWPAISKSWGMGKVETDGEED